MKSQSSSKHHLSQVENILGLLLFVCLGTWLTPWALERAQFRIVKDVAQKLETLEDAKARYLRVKGYADTSITATQLVPNFLDRWPCTYVGKCSDYKGGDMRTRATFREVALDELEDPVTYLESVKRLDVRPQDFLSTQS